MNDISTKTTRFDHFNKDECVLTLFLSKINFKIKVTVLLNF